MIFFCVYERYSYAVGESEYEYDEKSDKGPSKWGELKPEWAACGEGKLQSPIDLSPYLAETVPRSQEIITRYSPSTTTLQNRGHDISVSIYIYTTICLIS